MTRRAKCGRCGQPAEGFASINGVRYCHEGESPTCYELGSFDQKPPAWVAEAMALSALVDPCVCSEQSEGRTVHVSAGCIGFKRDMVLWGSAVSRVAAGGGGSHP